MENQGDASSTGPVTTAPMAWHSVLVAAKTRQAQTRIEKTGGERLLASDLRMGVGLVGSQRVEHRETRCMGDRASDRPRTGTRARGMAGPTRSNRAAAGRHGAGRSRAAQTAEVTRREDRKETKEGAKAPKDTRRESAPGARGVCSDVFSISPGCPGSTISNRPDQVLGIADRRSWAPPGAPRTVPRWLDISYRVHLGHVLSRD